MAALQIRQPIVEFGLHSHRAERLDEMGVGLAAVITNTDIVNQISHCQGAGCKRPPKG